MRGRRSRSSIRSRWLLIALLALSGCRIEFIRAPDAEQQAGRSAPALITVRIVNATSAALDPQIYVGPAAAGLESLFTAANKRTDFGLGGLGLLPADAEDSFSIPCGGKVYIATLGGIFGSNLNSPIGRGQQVVLEEDVNVRCTQVLTFTFSADGNELITEFSVRPWGD